MVMLPAIRWKGNMLLELESSQLVLIDYQTRLMGAMHEHEAATRNAVRLAQMAAALQVPAFYTEQNPSKLGATEPALLAALQSARARSLAKMQFSAVEEGLGEMLRPPAKPVQATPVACRSICRKPPLVASATPSSWRAVRPMSASCKPHSTCWKTSLTCGW